VAVPPISKTVSASIIPITPDKKVVPRPPRRPVARKRALPIGGRGRGRRGSEREKSPSGETHKSDEEESAELDREGSKGVPKSREILTVGDVTGVESSHLDEPVGAAKKPVLRRSKRSRKKDDKSSDNDDYVPKRRLVLDEGEVSAHQDSDRAHTAVVPSRTRTSTRLSRKRTVQERYGFYGVYVVVVINNKLIHMPNLLNL